MRTMIAKNCALLALSSLAAMAALGNTGVPITGIFLPPDLTDRHPGTPSCSNPYSQDYGADKAFDGNMTTKAGRWLSNEAASAEEKAWLRWDFTDGAHVVGAYLLQAHVDGDALRSPKTWRFEGSNDGGGTWSVLHEVSNEGAWALGEMRLYRFGGERAFSSYRIVYLSKGAHGQVGLQEIELYPPFEAREDVTETLNPALDNSGIRVKSSMSVTSGGTTYNASRVFDGDTTTKAGRWLAVKQSLQPVAWLSYRFDQGMLIDGYGFALLYDNAGDNNSRAPVSWEIQGSNDGGDTWMTIDSVEDFEWPVTIGRRQFFAANPGRYREVRLAISECGPGDYVGLQEVEIYGSVGRCPSVILLR